MILFLLLFHFVLPFVKLFLLYPIYNIFVNYGILCFVIYTIVSVFVFYLIGRYILRFKKKSWQGIACPSIIFAWGVLILFLFGGVKSVPYSVTGEMMIAYGWIEDLYHTIYYEFTQMPPYYSMESFDADKYFAYNYLISFYWAVFAVSVYLGFKGKDKKRIAEE